MKNHDHDCSHVLINHTAVLVPINKPFQPSFFVLEKLQILPMCKIVNDNTVIHEVLKVCFRCGNAVQFREGVRRLMSLCCQGRNNILFNLWQVYFVHFGRNEIANFSYFKRCSNTPCFSFFLKKVVLAVYRCNLLSLAICSLINSARPVSFK